jgi:hypothetical protein
MAALVKIDFDGKLRQPRTEPRAVARRALGGGSPVRDLGTPDSNTPSDGPQSICDRLPQLDGTCAKV